MFIVFRDVLINPADVSWARMRDWSYYSDESAEPWALLVHFRGVDEFLHFDYETHEKAEAALQDFMNLIRVAQENDR